MTKMNKLAAALLIVALGVNVNGKVLESSVATVNGKPILASEYNNYLQGVLDQYKANAPQVLEQPYAQDILGKEVLKGIIESDENSPMLGECALVNYHSPISNLGLTFKTTLFDENASCHLALGEGFPECYRNSNDLSKEELFQKGINKSKNHVDFMIGTSDLKIEAETLEGTILIMENGDLII